MRASVLSPLAALVLTASCATLSEEECRGGNWRAIGISDGMSGRSESFVSNHSEACSELGIAPDFASWAAGRTEGLRNYCTPERAYSAGRRGQRLNPVCGGYDLRALASANRTGLIHHEVERDIDQVRSQIRFAANRIDSLRDGDTTKGERSEIRRLRRDIDRWRWELDRLEWQRRSYGLW